MNKESGQAKLRQKHWLSKGTLDISQFRSQVEQKTRIDDWPLAHSVEQNALVYNASQLHQHLKTAPSGSPLATMDLMAEWAEVFLNGPGIIVIKGAFVDTPEATTRETTTLDRASELFSQLIEQERGSTAGGGDHFAKPGANDRIWNSLEKHCLNDTANFIAYYKNPLLALVGRAWLGPGYQVTAQVNRVNPGGDAQIGHRDYHLGFMGSDEATRFPHHVHKLSPGLTLQGAIAHCDMPLESGPTLYLPYSQHIDSGYVDFPSEEYQDYFKQHRSQYALEKGDAVFFNPALMHAAGKNSSDDIFRLANLLQISSPFGRAIESVDRLRMLKTLYPVLQSGSQQLSDTEINNVIAASAEGYAFPTNLDKDPPMNGMAPANQAAIVGKCLKENTDIDDAISLLDAHRLRTISG